MTASRKPLISVLGGGSWGTMVAQLVAVKGHRVRLWCRRPEQAREINKRRSNDRYLKGFKLSSRIMATANLALAVEDIPLVFVVIPAKSFRMVSRSIGEFLQPDQFVVHGTKGIEAGTYMRMSEILEEETCVRQLGVLAGPNIAKEIGAGLPAGAVVASRFPNLITASQEALVSERLRVYANDDVVGVELAGALKNIVAIASGMVSALSLGENARALLVTRGLSEIARVGVALGADPLTFSGVAGVGDLMVTCMSPHSRNHRVGAAIARGETLEQVVESLGMVAEGVHTSRVVSELIVSRGLDAPLLMGVKHVLDGKMTPVEALKYFMSLASRQDIDLALR